MNSKHTPIIVGDIEEISVSSASQLAKDNCLVARDQGATPHRAQYRLHYQAELCEKA